MVTNGSSRRSSRPARSSARTFGREQVRLVQHVGRKLFGQVVTQDREASRQIRRPQVFEHLDHTAMRRHVAMRTPRDLDDDVVALACTMGKAGRHVDRYQ